MRFFHYPSPFRIAIALVIHLLPLHSFAPLFHIYAISSIWFSHLSAEENILCVS